MAIHSFTVGTWGNTVTAWQCLHTSTNTPQSSKKCNICARPKGCMHRSTLACILKAKLLRKGSASSLHAIGTFTTTRQPNTLNCPTGFFWMKWALHNVGTIHLCSIRPTIIIIITLYHFCHWSETVTFKSNTRLYSLLPVVSSGDFVVHWEILEHAWKQNIQGPHNHPNHHTETKKVHQQGELTIPPEHIPNTAKQTKQQKWIAPQQSKQNEETKMWFIWPKSPYMHKTAHIVLVDSSHHGFDHCVKGRCLETQLKLALLQLCRPLDRE